MKRQELETFAFFFFLFQLKVRKQIGRLDIFIYSKQINSCQLQLSLHCILFPVVVAIPISKFRQEEKKTEICALILCF